jgi:hypothetical protein
LKQDYNFITKFAFDVYGEICEGKRDGYCNDLTIWAKETELFPNLDASGVKTWCPYLNTNPATVVKFFAANAAVFPWLPDSIQGPDQGTQAALYEIDSTQGKDTFVLSFRGSEGTGHCESDSGLVGKLTSNCMQEFLDDWLYTDLRSGSVKEDMCSDTTNTWKPNNRRWSLNSGKQVHKGFYLAYMSVREAIRTTLAAKLTSSSALYVTGHSLGGALSTLAGYDLTCNKVHGILPKIIALASPSVLKNAERFEAIVKPSHYLRVVTEESGGAARRTSSLRSTRPLGTSILRTSIFLSSLLTMQTRTVSLVGATLSNTTTSTQPSSE